MKLSETTKQNLVVNLLNIYREIGIDITVSDQFFCRDHLVLKDNNKNIRKKQNHYKQKNKDEKIKELEN